MLDRLLKPEVESVQKTLPTKVFEVPRLSKLAGERVEFTLRALPYGRVEEIRQESPGEQALHILLAGCVSPDLREARLLKKFGAPTPLEAVQALLLPGEIEDLSREVERLSGYRTRAIEEIKNA